MSRGEQETIIRGDANHKTWSICSADPKFIAKMRARGWEPKADERLGNDGYCFWEVPYKRVSVTRMPVLSLARTESLRRRGFKKGKAYLSKGGVVLNG